MCARTLCPPPHTLRCAGQGVEKRKKVQTFLFEPLRRGDCMRSVLHLTRSLHLRIHHE